MPGDALGESLKGFLRIGVFVGVGGVVLALFQPRESPEFVLSVCNGIIGLLLVVGVVVLHRYFSR
ncbi:MAG: hypothetical protein J5J04_14535 [Anaerolineae bacterium]|nr:hypothetical protein [Anaerolineae bacterium]MDL1915115.1 hypothetical protein [Anaerolineae bacterium CFX4]OQY82505.1 MAG: hypothetical protein B6D42_09225 [Anaerolineae bacterium UTCFX5]RIK21337.1 MAG: hypothetical protein DCC53_07255 [Chloroflexota bacterium]